MNEDDNSRAAPYVASNTDESMTETNATNTALTALTWQWCAFDELSLQDLYAILRLRQLVFIVEQECPYLDADDYDAKAWHLLGRVVRDDDATPLLAAYVRIFPPGIKYAEASIGRVVTHPDVRRTGMGKTLMREALRRTESLTPQTDIRIGAQMYLEKFYEGFGFRRVSEPYMEDGIPHIEMVRKAVDSR
ncbi:MAG TPA: GNAT family N-acetyltransferase [Pyrinomonadaceae bacterium]|jgi:ElaA protein